MVDAALSSLLRWSSATLDATSVISDRSQSCKRVRRVRFFLPEVTRHESASDETQQSANNTMPSGASGQEGEQGDTKDEDEIRDGVEGRRCRTHRPVYVVAIAWRRQVHQVRCQPMVLSIWKKNLLLQESTDGLKDRLKLSERPSQCQ
ncbi:unnamed protein product [Amoebophrya sp. A25]|nr:unnamed protein product [Amoebophrya sp. A25]|eukprot:GSA25T00014333001.1